MQSCFNAVEWMVSRKPSLARYGKDQLEHVLHFTLMWNMFESYLCNQSASVNALESLLRDLERNNQLQIVEFESYLSLFQSRYVSNGEFTERFPHLNLRRGDREDLVRSVLLGEKTDEFSTALTCLLIIYRYRNNLFHGIKDVNDLTFQRDIFEQSSMLLSRVLEASGV